MKALTLIRPWSWAITDGGKRVENRSWQPSWRGLRPGEPLLIHAGQRYDADGAVWMRNELGLDVPSEAACQKGLVALARFERCVADPLALPDEQVRWFFGPYGWLLGDVIPLVPFPCPGAQGLWDVHGGLLGNLQPRDEAQGEAFAEKYLRAVRRVPDAVHPWREGVKRRPSSSGRGPLA